MKATPPARSFQARSNVPPSSRSTEWASGPPATYGKGEGNKLTLLGQLEFPHSLGLLYSAFTYYCGFKVNSGEYKLMGLAPYGRPVYEEVILDRVIDLKADGSVWLNQEYFNYCQGLTMTSAKFHELFGGPAPHAGVAVRTASHGHRGQHPEGYRRSNAANGARGAPPNRHETSRDGRRCRAELRRQREDSARGAV
jgi:hypothetical protein